MRCSSADGNRLITPDLAYLLGALRDGSIYYNRAGRNYVTAFYQQSREWLEEAIAQRLIRLFGVHCRVEEYAPNRWRIRAYSKQLYRMWREDFGFPEEGIGQAHWTTPNGIMTANRDAKCAYIRGFFDAEGDVSPRTSTSPYIGFSQKNRQVLQDLQQLLKELDLPTGHIHTIDAKSGTLRFVIASKQALTRFITIINSEHPQKRRTLHRLSVHLGQ